MNVGLRNHYIASCHAAKVMTKQNNGVIINISSQGAKDYLFFLAYGVGKCAVDRMTSDMAFELKDYNVASISLWPGLVKTEKMLEHSNEIEEEMYVDLEGTLPLNI
jgi:NAD(P)-dependent dehydrogenase (short-subunit alcohol dehydrogenase family)